MAEKYEQKYLKYKTKYLLLKQKINQLNQSGNGFNYLTLQNDIKALKLNSVEVYGSKKMNSIYVKFNNSQYKLKIENNNNDKYFATLYIESTNGTPVKNVIGLSSDEGTKFMGNKQALLNKITEINAQLNVVPNKVIPTPSTNEYFFEKQQGLGCGRHALNNLLQMQKFVHPRVYFETYTKERLIELAEDKKGKINLDAFCRFLHSINVSISYGIKVNNYCKKNEDYDIGVLVNALALLGHENADYNIANESSFDDEANVFGYLINISNGYHWVSVRKYGSKYVYFDSTEKPMLFENINELNRYLINYNKNGKNVYKIIKIFNYDERVKNNFYDSMSNGKSAHTKSAHTKSAHTESAHTKSVKNEFYDKTKDFEEIKNYMVMLYFKNTENPEINDIIYMIYNSDCIDDLIKLKKYDKDYVIGIFTSIKKNKQPEKLTELLELLKISE